MLLVNVFVTYCANIKIMGSDLIMISLLSLTKFIMTIAIALTKVSRFKIFLSNLLLITGAAEQGDLGHRHGQWVPLTFAKID